MLVREYTRKSAVLALARHYRQGHAVIVFHLGDEPSDADSSVQLVLICSYEDLRKVL